MPLFEHTPAALLCGGLSERLNYPKEMLRVDGAPLAVHLARRLREVFASVSVISNHPDYLRYCFDGPILSDEFQQQGPLAGLHAGLKHASPQSGAGRCFFLACDMPLVHNALIRRILERSERSRAPAVVASANGRLEPLCGVYSTELVPVLERRLSSPGRESRSVRDFLAEAGFETVDFTGEEAALFRDLDKPEDLFILNKVFSDVEPLPVCLVSLSKGKRDRDVVAEEWPVAVFVNGLKLVTVMCLPTALREMAVGLAAYLGLVKQGGDIQKVEVDYAARRVLLDLSATDDDIRNASQVLISSTCGASIYGGQIQPLPEAIEGGDFRVALSHILECLKSLRGMGPVFARAGSTHQAAFSDGKRILLFFEDIGRHNAVDKIIGSALLRGADMTRGLLVSTGRLSSEMVVKAARQGVPVLASPSGVTTNAIRLADSFGLTFLGFARGGRANLYTRPERVLDE